MKLKEYFKQIGNKELMAEKLETSVDYLNQLAGFHRKPSTKLAKKIERFTGGLVTRWELLYPEDFPD